MRGKIWFAVLAAALFMPLLSDGAVWRGVAVRENGEVRVILYDGLACKVSGKPIPDELFGKELKLTGSLSPVQKKAPDAMRTVFVQDAAEQQPEPAAEFQPGKPNFYAKTGRTIPQENRKPNANFDLELPELGNSASSGGRNPIKMSVHLPANYKTGTRHPVILHFGGGTGNSQEGLRWRSIVGDKNFIVIGADYNHDENEKKGTLSLGTCRDFNSRIARHILQLLRNSTMFDQDAVILSGLSSGAYSITDNMRNSPKSAWEPFAGFVAMGGGSKTSGARLGERSVLFLMGKNDTIRHGWLDEAVKGLAGSKVRVEIVEGVGHEWSDAFTPIFLDWLYTDIPAARAIRQRREIVEKTEDEALKKIVQSWIDASGLE